MLSSAVATLTLPAYGLSAHRRVHGIALGGHEKHFAQTPRTVARELISCLRRFFSRRGLNPIKLALYTTQGNFLSMDTSHGRKEAVWDKEIIQGTTPGRRRRERPKTNWYDSITEWIGLKGHCLLRSGEDRRQWRKIVHEAVNPRIEGD